MYSDSFCFVFMVNQEVETTSSIIFLPSLSLVIALPDICLQCNDLKTFNVTLLYETFNTVTLKIYLVCSIDTNLFLPMFEFENGTIDGNRSK